MKIFVDETAWIALIDSQNEFHTAVKHEFSRTLNNEDRIFTHNVALGNALNDIKIKLGMDLLRQFGAIIEDASAGAHLTILWINRRNQKEAIRLLRNHPDLTLNLYDHAAYLFMNRRRIRTILTTNKAFKELGLKVIPEPGE